jgi:hypothetical protein
MVNYSDSTKMFSETDIIKMLDFLIALTILKYLFCLMDVFFNRQLITINIHVLTKLMDLFKLFCDFLEVELHIMMLSL